MFQLSTRLGDILNYPLFDRIRQLMICIETAPIKDLQAFYPMLISHIFGYSKSIGWGLRTVTEKNSNDFKILYEFFHPHSSFFQLIYRLLNQSIKYEMKISELPIKLQQMLESGRYNSFYSTIVNFDNFQPQNMSLSLNAFDFFMFNFCIHGMKNFHKTSQAALNVNSEGSKTVYFNLAADYLCNFLPADPNAVVYPQIECSPVKTQPSMPMQTNQPTKPTKYLLLSALKRQIQSPTESRADIRLPEAVKSSNWRSESVMMIFIDCWLRYDVDESYDLPGNEFIRLVRILVKQLHFFGNVSEQDLSTLSVLRHQAHILLNLRMYPFLKTIISRWPLDTSFLNVLEMWLSYIQPWRYIYNRNIQNLNNEMLDIPDRFKVFISENIISYTQIFVRLIPRFLKMDLSLNKNAFMLFRMMKVFRKPSEIIKEIEKQMKSSNNTTIRSHNSSLQHDQSSRSPRSFSPQSHSHRQHNHSTIDDSNYIFMFNDEISMQIYELMRRLYSVRIRTEREAEKMEKELQKHASLWDKFLQLIGWLSSLNLSFSTALDEKKRTMMYLEVCLNFLSPVYSIPIEEVANEVEQNVNLESSDNECNSMNNSDVLNITPSFMKRQLKNISYTGDPLLLPIMKNEVKWLVRFLHQISNRVNEMFENEFNLLWNRGDIYGRLSRLFLTEPVEIRIFDKSAGYSELKVQQIGPRLSLRKLAKWKVVILLLTSLLFGRLFLGASSLGFMLLFTITFLYVFVKSLMSS
ncbi:CLUMA_CG009869, isoform A [Clunio marinus]|uniref:CLUMA_CG009869, isoform A n=1 Tax=Clunio marinus TaxID=568069 RepID=A0A1J1I9D6_9DIPT|nr:CLUMA_CG009869, isoform A [Clunio marinus]